jgi:dihydrofolate reductase
MPIVSLVVAMTEPGHVIGNSLNEGGLPWMLEDLPSDLRSFRKHTIDKPIAMGWNTFDFVLQSAQGLLPRREHVVITRGHGADVEKLGGIPADSPSDALRLLADEREVCVIGGAQIYKEFLPHHADRLLITHVHADLPGDAHFPEWSRADWNLNHEESEVIPRRPDPRDKYLTTFSVYERRRMFSKNARV